MLRILEHKTLYRTTRFHAAFPSVARFSDGRLLLAFRRARDGMWLVPEAKRGGFDPFARMDHIDSRSHIVLLGLDAEGAPVAGEEDQLPCDPEASDQDPSLLVLADDQLLVASFSYYPLPACVDDLLPARAESADARTGCRYLPWGCHTALRGRQPGNWLRHRVYLRPDGGYGREIGVDEHHPMVGAIRGQPLYREGEILLPVYWGAADGAGLFASVDGGKTWRLRGSLARDGDGGVNYQEPTLCHGDQGELVCFMRTAGAQGRLASSRSSDGTHWSEPRLHSVVGQPFHALRLGDGRVLLSYGYREGPFGIRVRLLPHAAADPDDHDEIVIRGDGLCADIGYPWGVQLVDGRVMVVYYWTDRRGMRGIEASWLAL